MPNPTPTQADREEAARLLPCSIDPDRPCRDDPERCLNRERCHLPAMCDPCSALEDLAAALAARDAANAERIAELESQAAAMRAALEEQIGRHAENDDLCAWDCKAQHARIRTALSAPAGRELLDAAREACGRMDAACRDIGAHCDNLDGTITARAWFHLHETLARLRRAVEGDSR